MKKRTIVIIIAIIVIAILAFSVYKLTGGSISGFSQGCVDSDNGMDFYVKGTASYEVGNEKSTDYCVKSGGLKEFYCDSALDRIRSIVTTCICEEGICIE